MKQNFFAPIHLKCSIAYRGVLGTLVLPCILGVFLCSSEAIAQDDLAQHVQQLTDAMNRIQAQMEDSKRQLDEMRPRGWRRSSSARRPRQDHDPNMSLEFC